MLDPRQRLILRDFPTAQIYQDEADQAVFYVVPWIPLLESEDDGRPSIRLLIFLKHHSHGKKPSGGQLMLTTSLELNPQVLSRVTSAIQEQLQAEKVAQSTPSAGPTTVRVSYPEWLSGKVEIRVADSLVLSGQPSLFGGNRCSLMSRLSADQACAIRDEWERQLPKGRITYQMVMRVAAKATDTREVTGLQAVRHPDEHLSESTHVTRVDVRATVASTMPITIEGPLWKEGLNQQIVELEIT